jgi:hypothetical protein
MDEKCEIRIKTRKIVAENAKLENFIIFALKIDKKGCKF